MLPKLEKDDYLNKGYEFWKNYREKLTEQLLGEQDNVIEKNPQNIVKMAHEIGVKPTARYFNIDPSSVRYYIKKYE